MMDWRLQLFLALCCLLFFVLCVHLLRKGIMEVKYALLWLAGSILMGLVVLFPEGLFALAKLVGIIDPTNMVFFLAFFPVPDDYLQPVHHCFEAFLPVAQAGSDCRDSGEEGPGFGRKFGWLSS